MSFPGSVDGEKLNPLKKTKSRVHRITSSRFHFGQNFHPTIWRSPKHDAACRHGCGEHTLSCMNRTHSEKIIPTRTPTKKGTKCFSKKTISPRWSVSSPLNTKSPSSQHKPGSFLYIPEDSCPSPQTAPLPSRLATLLGCTGRE